MLEIIAEKALWVGASGAGHTLKLLNQLMFSTINCITVEVLAIAKSVGLYRKVLFDSSG